MKTFFSVLLLSSPAKILISEISLQIFNYKVEQQEQNTFLSFVVISQRVGISHIFKFELLLFSTNISHFSSNISNNPPSKSCILPNRKANIILLILCSL